MALGPIPKDPAIGERFGRWVVIGPGLRVPTKIVGKPKRCVPCRCECGAERVVTTQSLRLGTSLSCGCLNREISRAQARHGHSRSAEYKIWSAMKERCHNKNTVSYKNYGGRGIEVCRRWRDDFQAFFSDMGARPTSKHSIDRIDNDKGYCPENCRWASAREQHANRRIAHKVEMNGEMIAVGMIDRPEWLSIQALKGRLRQGWNITDALTRPLGPNARQPSSSSSSSS